MKEVRNIGIMVLERSLRKPLVSYHFSLSPISQTVVDNHTLRKLREMPWRAFGNRVSVWFSICLVGSVFLERAVENTARHRPNRRATTTAVCIQLPQSPHLT